ncbi:MAG: hypothetical protein ABIH03_11285 [Pseudomonadota bacterium]
MALAVASSAPPSAGAAICEAQPGPPSNQRPTNIAATHAGRRTPADICALFIIAQSLPSQVVEKILFALRQAQHERNKGNDFKLRTAHPELVEG